MKRLLSFLLIIALARLAASETFAPDGAWLEEGISWIKAPADVNPGLQSGEGEILYFASNARFGFIDCYVLLQSNRMRISNGDPRNVYNGEWTFHNSELLVRYHLTEGTVLPVGSSLPGPTKIATVGVSVGPVLIFNGKRFRREPRLDEIAQQAIYSRKGK